MQEKIKYSKEEKKEINRLLYELIHESGLMQSSKVVRLIKRYFYSVKQNGKNPLFSYIGVKST